MCGIVGILRFDGTPVEASEIGAMSGSIAHRGPDDHGLLIEPGLGMGMRRLSIVDLSPSGHQPLFNEDRSIAVVYNGEIYNHRDLRSRLQIDGHTFVGRSDTEVLVHGYEQFGIRELVARLSGMFAFALYDRPRRRLFLARDGIGIKPLYLRKVGKQLSFASELRAFTFDGGGPLSIDPGFTRTYLRLGYVPSPSSAFVGITRLAPGTFCDVDLATGEMRVEAYYRLQPRVERDSSGAAVLERLRELLNAAVRRHLMADVPTGLFLSGGLDSSALTVFANHHTLPPKTFSIGFSASDRGDETGFAAMVARSAGNENVRIDLGPGNLDDLGRIVEAIEEPLADSAVLPLWHLCEGTSKHVKVALSGEGGDEVFGGYGRYFWGLVFDRAGSVLTRHATRLSEFTHLLPSRTLGIFNVARRAAKAADSATLDEASRHLNWSDIFTGDERRALLGDAPGPDQAEERFQSLYQAARELGLDPVQRMQYVDIQTFLLDNLLMKADKLSMAHSLEVRVPFLDRTLVEFGLGLAPTYKVGLFRDKNLMRDLLRPKVGARIANRPKRGLEIPVDRWFREPTTEPLRRKLRDGPLVHELGFNAAAIDNIIARHLGGEDVGRKLFALSALEQWSQRVARRA
jgi:asparagine synthase (glutamine-hydrolysing)